MKGFRGLLTAVCALGWAAAASAASPWAVWSGFPGLSADRPLAPNGGFVQQGIDASQWLFRIGGGTVGEDGSLSTGAVTPRRLRSADR